MLDGRSIKEIGGYERPRSVKSVAGSKFAEHIAVEMEDTSSVSIHDNEVMDYSD